MRAAWNTLHLWLGLIFGFWLALVGLTGAILVFHYELEEVCHPGVFTVTARAGGQAAYLPVGAIEAAGLAALPEGAKLGFAYYPRTDAGSYWLMASVPLAAGGAEDNWSVFVDPYSGRVLGRWLTKSHDAWYGREFFSFIFDLHYQLLLPWRYGGIVVGIVALAAIASLLLGSFLWWPRRGNWRRALTLKKGASSRRFVFDLHNLCGIYLFPVTFFVLLSGVYFNLPDQFFAVLRVFSPGTANRYDLKSTVPAGGAGVIGLQRAFEIVRARHPEGRPDWLYNANEADSTYTICAKHVHSVSAFADRRCVNVDRYSGEILWVTAPGAHGGGNTFIAWQWPLHSGEAFGLTGRILVLLSGLALPALFATGVIRWRHKAAAKRIARQRRAASMAA